MLEVGSFVSLPSFCPREAKKWVSSVGWNVYCGLSVHVL